MARPTSTTTKSKPSRILGYVRVSTDAQADSGLGLDAQREKLDAWAKLHGASLVEVIEDAGYSAKSLDRPGIQRALQMLRDGEADALLVAKLDRLTRSVTDLGSLLSSVFVTRDLISVTESLDGRTAAGRMMLVQFANIAQWERETTAERVRDATWQLAAQGYASSRMPLGYRAKRTSPEGERAKKSTVEIDPDTAAIVRRMFALRVEGASFPDLSRFGKTMLPDRAWPYAQARRIIMNPVYKGQWSWGVRGKHGRTPLVMERPELALVSPELWALAQEPKPAPQFEPRKRGGQPRYLLSGLLECPECGSTLVCTTNARRQGQNQFLCNKARLRLGCEWKERVRQGQITDALVTTLRAMLDGDRAQEIMRKEWLRLVQLDAEAMRAQGPDPRKEIRRLEAQVQRVISMELEAETPSPGLAKKRAELEAQVEVLRRSVPTTADLSWESVQPFVCAAQADLATTLAADVHTAREALRRALGNRRLVIRREGDVIRAEGALTFVAPDVGTNPPKKTPRQPW